MKKTLTIIALCLSFFVASGQSTTTNKKALRYYQDGREYEAERAFDKALVMYERATKSDPNFAEAYQKMGILNNVLGNSQKARVHFDKAVEVAPDNKAVMYSYFEAGRFRMDDGKYQEAKSLLDKFLKYVPKGRLPLQEKEAKRILGNISYALRGMQKPVDFDPKPLPDALNSATHQFFPVLTADQQTIIYTIFEEDASEDFYEAKLENGEWTAPKPIIDINTDKNEGTCSITADGRMMIFTACEGAEGRKILGSCDLFVAYKTGDKWSEPQNLGAPVNSRNWESQPALSADGSTLYFVSDRAGGRGKRDIWMSKRDSQDRWTRPVNLGPTINTEQEEYSPFIHANGKNLFFSSNGHQGYGKLDLFRSDLNAQGKWGRPQNLGYPINNANNQVGLFITSDGKRGYYSDGIVEGNRRVADKLFTFGIEEEAESPLKVSQKSDVIKGVVYDAKTKKPLGAKINLIDRSTEETVYSVSSDSQNGKYSIVLTQGANYALYVDQPGYLFKSLTFDFKEKNSSQTLEQDIYLDPIEKGSSVELKNIFFASDSYELGNESIVELKKLYKFMLDNPEVRLEIGAHTDDQGAAEYNRKLSENRAKVVVNYLREKGVDENRLIWKGYGETQPIGDNTTEEGRALNRRIAFVVL